MTETLQNIVSDTKEDTYELRVIALDSKEKNRILVPQGEFRLPRGLVSVDTSIEKVAYSDILPAHRMHLPPMTSVARLDDVDNIKGYVVEPVSGSKVDLRKDSAFSVSAYYAEDIITVSEQRPEMYDPVDVAFVKQLLAKPYRR